MSASLSSITSGETQPTPTACSPNIAPNGINVTGLVGQICQVNVPPSEVNITSCCDSGAEVRLQDNCTQWCEVNDGGDFFDCINDMTDPSYPFLSGPCQIVGEDATVTVSSTGTGVTPTTSTSEGMSQSTEEVSASTTGSGGGAETTETPEEGVCLFTLPTEILYQGANRTRHGRRQLGRVSASYSGLSSSCNTKHSCYPLVNILYGGYWQAILDPCIYHHIISK